MSNRALLTESSWKVFLDGVEVPHQGFELTMGRNSLSYATISIQPDVLLTQLRPQTLVSIWAKERFIDDDTEYADEVEELANRYYLFWEGLVSGYTHVKAEDTRIFTLKCESLFAVWTRTKAFAFAVGIFAFSPVIGGTTAIPINNFTNQDTFTLQHLSQLVSGGLDTEATFLDRVLSSVTYLSSMNASLRLQTDRYKLLGRISGIADGIYEQLLAPIAANLLLNTTQIISESSSVFDVISHFQTYGFYSSYQIPVPTPIKLDEKFVAPSFSGIPELYNLSSSFRQNDLLLLPELYYAMPPPCNLIFPEMMQSLAVDRSFYEEPTRTLVQDPFIGTAGRVFFLAPQALDRFNVNNKSTSSVELFGIALSAITLDKSEVVSPYQSSTSDTSSVVVDLFNFTTDQELEKGIVTNIDSYSFETLTAYARAQVAEDTVKKDVYQAFITEIVGYRHKMAQFNRRLNVQLVGLRYLTPGFTAAIFDSDISYLGFVESISFAVNAVGSEISSAALSYVRPILPIDENKLSEFKEDIREAVRTRKHDVAAAYTKPSTQEVAEALVLARATASKAVDVLINSFVEELNVPIPPAFMNADIATLTQLDGLYQSLLGCKPLYTSEYNVNPLSGFSLITEFGEQGASLLSYIQGVSVLNNIYTMFRSLEQTSATSRPLTWQSVHNSKNALGPSTFEWVHRRFSKRTRLYLSAYAEQHKLLLDRQLSSGPSRVYFYTLTPAALGSNDSDGWDNSIFSKLVMEEGKVDPVIARLRESASDFLKTTARQALILAYAQKHFGGRAFDGS